MSNYVAVQDRLWWYDFPRLGMRRRNPNDQERPTTDFAIPTNTEMRGLICFTRETSVSFDEYQLSFFIGPACFLNAGPT